MNHFLGLRRLFYCRRVGEVPIRDWLTAALPVTSLDARQANYLVVDLEMTGLDYRRDKILSIGWIAINNGAISLNSAEHLYIKRSESVGQSAIIHQIRDVDLRQGISEEQALIQLLAASQDRIVVFHSAQLDCRFLTAAWRRWFGAPFLAPVVDTLQLEQQNFSRAGKPTQAGDLRLAACRQRYNLPLYPAHNALVDALATAELLLAILVSRGRCSLRTILA